MINHWNCEHCKSYNDILNDYCKICNVYKPSFVTSIHQNQIQIQRGVFLHHDIYGIDNMTEQEELFAKFYNQEKILVKDMDMAQLRQHREELSKIAFEAKCRLVAADDEVKDKTPKSKADWLTTSDNASTSDAINAPKVRAARMSKMDKIKNQLLAAGIDDDTVKEMVRELERKATEKNVKAFTFTRKVDENNIVVVEEKQSNSEPFDWNGLITKD